MRFLMAVFVMLLLTPASHAQDEAKNLYEAMEQKLTKAKSHKVVFETVTTTFNGFLESHVLDVKGTFVVAPGGQARIIFEGKSDEKQSKVTWISDGKKMLLQTETGGKMIKNPREAPDKLYEALASAAIRMSLTQSINASLANPKPMDLSVQKAFAFKTIGKEKIGDKEADVIEYKMETPGAKNVMTCTLALDPKTNLPLQRVVLVESAKGDLMMVVVENYSSWELDPKLPDDTFTLPK